VARLATRQGLLDVPAQTLRLPTTKPGCLATAAALTPRALAGAGPEREGRRREVVESCRRPWLVADRATLPQKWPPLPRNVADPCKRTAPTKPGAGAEREGRRREVDRRVAAGARAQRGGV